MAGGRDVLTQDATLICRHDGHVRVEARGQNFVTVEQRLVLVATDPEGRSIVGCPMAGPGIKPCTTTLRVELGYSTYWRIANRPVCRDTVTGLTDGTPPGTVDYRVRNPGQNFVRSDG